MDVAFNIPFMFCSSSAPWQLQRGHDDETKLRKHNIWKAYKRTHARTFFFFFSFSSFSQHKSFHSHHHQKFMTTTVYDAGCNVNVDPDAKPGTFTGPTGLTAVGFAGEFAAFGSSDAIVHI